MKQNRFFLIVSAVLLIGGLAFNTARANVRSGRAFGLQSVGSDCHSTLPRRRGYFRQWGGEDCKFGPQGQPWDELHESTKESVERKRSPAEVQLKNRVKITATRFDLIEKNQSPGSRKLRGVVADNEYFPIILFHETKAVTGRHGLRVAVIVCETERVGTWYQADRPRRLRVATLYFYLPLPSFIKPSKLLKYWNISIY